MKISHSLATVLLTNTGVLRHAEIQGAQMIIERTNSKQLHCYDPSSESKKLRYHATIVKGIVWSMVKGSTVVRHGYIADNSANVIELLARPMMGEDSGKKSTGREFYTPAVLPVQLPDNERAEYFAILRQFSLV